jgi:hypothetical protein
MNKIAPDHLARSAFVYVRQSTPDQLINNPESRRRQYALATRARTLGWENVVVIDDDLGRSGGGTARPGFERLLTSICTGTAGAVLAIEASRLARNGRDWHTLLEFCTLVNCLIIDEDGVYDPKLVNDRLLLGLKGTFSELELSILRQRRIGSRRSCRSIWPPVSGQRAGGAARARALEGGFFGCNNVSCLAVFELGVSARCPRQHLRLYRGKPRVLAGVPRRIHLEVVAGNHRGTQRVC